MLRNLSRRATQLALFGMLGGLSGCSCGSDADQGLPAASICVTEVGDSVCQPDNTALDWGTVAVLEVATLERVIENRGNGNLLIDNIQVTNDSGHGELFTLELCDGASCITDEGFGIQAVLLPGQSRTLRVSFDAQVDGEVPTERLVVRHNDPNDNVNPERVYYRTFEGLIEGCTPGFADANMDIADGCECELIQGAEEVCDGVDNDCNGTIDDGLPGEGIACETGLAGACANGETGCYDGQWGCQPILSETAEVCDGEDNDCDGLIDEEGTWVPYDEGLSGGQMTEVAFDPRTAGAAYALVGNQTYASQDGGLTFAKVGEAPDVLRMLAFPPGDANVLLAAGDSGLYLSEDQGETWLLKAFGGLALRSVYIHPADPARLFVGTTGAGIFVSTNGGDSFTSANVGVPYSRIENFSGDPSDPSAVVATVADLTPQGVTSGQGQVIRTDDGGASWTSALPNVSRAFGLARCDNDASILYAGLWGDGIAQSTDGGQSWTFATGLASANGYDVALSPTDCSRVYATTFADGLHRSTNGAQSFVGPLATGLNSYPGQLAIAVDPVDHERLLAANQSGVFLTVNGGNTWTRVEKIQAANVTNLAANPANPSQLWMSTWGQGTWNRANPTTAWEVTPANALPRDYAFTVSFAPDDAQRVLVGSAGDMWLSTNGGAAFSQVEVGVNALQFAYDPVATNTVYAATQTDGVLKSSDGGSTWFPANNGLPPPWLSGPCTCQDIRAIAADPTNGNVIVGTAGEGLFRTTDGGNNWQEVATTLPGSAGCFAFDGPFLWACVGGSGIWRSQDGGVSFSPVTQGNPDLSNVSDILVDPDTGDIYATSDAGVFLSTDDGATWSGLDNACLPTTKLVNPKIITSNGQRQIVIATTGAGVFTLPL